MLQKESSIYVVGKRNKGDFPWFSTHEFTNCVVRGLHGGNRGIKLGLEMESECVLNAIASSVTESPEPPLPVSKKQKKIDHRRPSEAKMNIDFSVCLNPKQPLSLLNCECSSIPNHSLGWLSNSVRPPSARAMCSLAISEKELLREDGIITEKNDSKIKAKPKQSAPLGMEGSPVNKVSASLVVNTMCGEGTIEIESTRLSSNRPFFMIAGDLNVASLKRTVDRLTALRQKTTPRSVSISKPLDVDFVLWDAQRLPLRGDIVDSVLADMPFMGSTKKAHQIPTATGTSSIVKADESSSSLTSQRQKHSITPTLDYQQVLNESCRVLQNCNATNMGRAAFVSADSKALSHAVTKCQHRWNVLWKVGVNIGGLQGKLFLLERKPPPFKDLSFWVRADAGDSLTTENSVLTTSMSSFIFSKALEACSNYFMDTKSMELKIKSTGKSDEIQEGKMIADGKPLVTKVDKIDEFYHPTKKVWTHCYRLWFDGCLLDSQAKLLEKDIRSAVLANIPKGYELR